LEHLPDEINPVTSLLERIVLETPQSIHDDKSFVFTIPGIHSEIDNISQALSE